MTDAERIAGLLRIRASEVDVALTYAEAYDRAWEGALDIGALMTMLSDVRREEREACAKEVQCEIDGANHRWSKSSGCFGNGLAAQIATGQAQALGWALKHINARGHK